MPIMTWRFKDCLCINGEYPSPEVSTAIAEYMKANDARGFACITTDPPYGDIAESSWETSASEAQDIYSRIAAKVKTSLLPGGAFLMWGGIGKPHNRVFLRTILMIEDKHGFDLKNLITWSKKRAYGKADDYLFTREELAWFQRRNEKPRAFNIPLLEEKRGYAGYNAKYPAKSEFKRRTNVWTDVTEILRGKIHEAEKPTRLYEIIYSTHSNPGEVVMDICAGSGAAGEAALAIGRKVILIEKDPDIFKRMCERIEEGPPDRSRSTHNLSEKTIEIYEES